MKHITFSKNYIFYLIEFFKYHYTDNRKGSPMNYIACMLKGTAQIESDNNTIFVKEGDVFFIPKNLGYQSYWYGDDDIKFISLGFKKLNTDDSLDFKLQIVPTGSDIIEKIKIIPANCANVSCRALSIFYDIMDEIIPCLKRDCYDNGKYIIENIKECIRKYPHCSLSEIAEKCSISEPYLYSLFKKHTSVTPNFFKQQVLCEMGIELLLTTNKKVEEISQILEFSSCSYFRKVLKLHTGSTPSQIRKNHGF